MTYQITFNPDVKNDVQEAVDWYNKKQPGLGRKFYNNIQIHIDLLKKSAHSLPNRYDKIRCLPIKKYPYMIHYRVNTNLKQVRIEAIFHTSRDPKLWQKRIK